MTIYDIKEKTKETEPYFFSRDTMKFFHQTMRDFHVKKQTDGRYYVYAIMRDHSGRQVGLTQRWFNPLTNKLELK